MDNLLGIIKNIFNRLDSRILGHGERVAYLVYNLLLEENNSTINEIKDAVVLSLLHDIGALRTDEVDDLMTFDSGNTLPHCIYGYLFMKYFSPVHKRSKILLYHHTPYNKIDPSLSETDKKICNLIHLADRIDVWYVTKDSSQFSNINNHFNEKYFQLFLKANKDNKLIKSLSTDEFNTKIEEINHLFTEEEIEKYLEMIVFAIDFRSYQTVTHSLLAALIAIDIGKIFKLSKKEIDNLYLSALLHDVGKVSTPSAILEKHGKLTSEEMEIMKDHVVATREIIEGYAPKDIMYPAIRHHERVDGSGYPLGLDSSELTISDSILMIADITSALIMKRSYKEPFSKEKTLSILSQLCDEGKIDRNVYQVLFDNYDNIINDANDGIAEQEEKFVAIKEEYFQVFDIHS